MISFPNAKINLGLNILRKREDGFHEIESVFYPIPFHEVLEISPSSETKFESSGIEIPGGSENNLVLRAYELIAEDYKIPPLLLHLHKVIPIGAGLGGGSSDASFALKMINDKFDLKISRFKLEKYAGQLGSDCPFFIKNRPVLAAGRGEKFEKIQCDLSGYKLLLVNPRIHIGTAEAYSGVSPSAPEKPIKEIIEQTNIKDWKYELKNDFEKSAFSLYPELELIKQSLYENGAIYASMTGSGSTFYGIFKEKTSQLKFPEYDTWWFDL